MHSCMQYHRAMAKRKTYDVQIRGVPADLRDKLKRRAASKGVPMSQYVVKVLKDDLERPTLAEWLEMVRRDPPVPGLSGAAIVRELRDELEEGIRD